MEKQALQFNSSTADALLSDNVGFLFCQYVFICINMNVSTKTQKDNLEDSIMQRILPDV